jgi:hypothetical protein
MKRILLISLFFAATALPLAAQLQRSSALNLLSYDYQRRWRFGFSIGMNVFDFAVTSTMKPMQTIDMTNPEVLWADVVNIQPGFNINGIVNYRLSRHLDLRALPGICFGTRELNFYKEDGSLAHSMLLESNYAEVPLLLKFSASRVSNYRPYLVGGANPRFNMNWKTSEKKGNYISSIIFEPFLELGCGLDIYFYYFKLSIEFKYSKTFINNLGSNTVTGYEGFHEAIDRLNSQIFIFAIHIE